MGRPLLRLLVLLIITLTPARFPTAGAATASKTVSGTVANGTQGGPVPAGLEVTVVQLDGTQKEIARRSTMSGVEGQFSVGGFEQLGEARYLAMTTYRGVAYSKIVNAEASDVQRIDLKVFETTRDDSAIRVESETLTVVQGVEDQMEVLQVVRIANRSDRTFVGPSTSSAADTAPITVRLPLPEGAFDVSLSDTLRQRGVEATPEGLGTGEPVLPGETSYSFAYKVRVPRSGWQLRRPVLYSTERIDLLIDDQLTTTAPGFQLQERPELGGKKYLRYRDGPFLAGDILGADIGYATAGAGSGIFFGVGAATLLILVAGLGLFARKRRNSHEKVDRKDLIHRIAELDEAFAQGRIEEGVYASSRERMKKQLLDETDASLTDRR